MSLNELTGGEFGTGNAHAPIHYVARQPILTANESVIGYELLFRSSTENRFYCSNPNNATRAVIDISNTLGLDALCDRGLAFINCTNEVILEGNIRLLPPDRTVIEILESAPLDFAVCMACRKLKAAGYRIALDDFTFNDPRECLIDLADFIKVDLRLTAPAKVKDIVARYKSQYHQMLAEKVETHEEFQFTKQAGFQFFQGFFFSRPQMVCTQSIFADCPTCLGHFACLDAV